VSPKSANVVVDASKVGPVIFAAEESDSITVRGLEQIQHSTAQHSTASTATTVDTPSLVSTASKPAQHSTAQPAQHSTAQQCASSEHVNRLINRSSIG
jgi:hypothetical protein